MAVVLDKGSENDTSQSAYELLGRSEPRRTQGIDFTHGLFDKSKSTFWSRNAPLFCIGLLIVTIIFEIIVIPVPIWLSGEHDDFSTAQRTIYTTFIAMLASIISAVVIGAIRNLWLLDIIREDDANINFRKAQTLLQIGSFRDQFRFRGLAVALVVFGLITSSLVGSMTVTVVDRAYSTFDDIFMGAEGGEVYRGYTPKAPYFNDCWYSSPGGEPLSEPTISWVNNTDQSYFASNLTAQDSWCPLNLRKTVNNVAAVTEYSGFLDKDLGSCQAVFGGLVGCQALGTPVSNDPSCGIQKTLSCQNLLNGQACAPVFISNPVRCKPSGAYRNVRNSRSVITDDCHINFANASVPWTNSNSSYLVGFCTDGRAIGDGTLVLGTDAPELVNALSAVMVDDKAANSSSYSLQCDISLNSTLGFRKVYNTTIQYNYDHVPSIDSRQETCDPTPKISGLFGTDSYGLSEQVHSIEDILNVNGRALAATMLTLVFNQSLGDLLNEISPYVTLGGRYADRASLDPRAFADSNNLLEDYLSVQVATYMSYYWGVEPSSIGASTGNLAYSIDYVYPSDRIGPGSAVAIIYILPPLFAAVCLGVLWYRVRHLL